MLGPECCPQHNPVAEVRVTRHEGWWVVMVGEQIISRHYDVRDTAKTSQPAVTRKGAFVIPSYRIALALRAAKEEKLR